MTSLTFHISRSIGNTLQTGDRILLSKLDHEANISPWQLMARDKKVEVDFVEIDAETCTFNKDDLERKLAKNRNYLHLQHAPMQRGHSMTYQNLQNWGMMQARWFM